MIVMKYNMIVGNAVTNQLCRETSMPSLMGWRRYGVANVASTIVTTPGSVRANEEIASRSMRDMFGLVGVSQ